MGNDKKTKFSSCYFFNLKMREIRVFLVHLLPVPHLVVDPLVERRVLVRAVLVLLGKPVFSN